MLIESVVFVALQLIQGQLQLLHQIRRQHPQLLQQLVSLLCERERRRFSLALDHSFLQETRVKDQAFSNHWRGLSKAQNAVFLYF